MIRRFTASVFPIFNNKVLLINHKKLNMWLPSGGKMEANESPLQAAQRELFEETGLVGKYPEMKNEPYGTPNGYIGYEEHYIHNQELHMNFCFMCLVDTDEIKSDGSFTDHKWVSPIEGKRLVTLSNVNDLLSKIDSLM